MLEILDYLRPRPPALRFHPPRWRRLRHCLARKAACYACPRSVSYSAPLFVCTPLPSSPAFSGLLRLLYAASRQLAQADRPWCLREATQIPLLTMAAPFDPALPPSTLPPPIHNPPLSQRMYFSFVPSFHLSLSSGALPPLPRSPHGPALFHPASHDIGVDSPALATQELRSVAASQPPRRLLDCRPSRRTCFFLSMLLPRPFSSTLAWRAAHPRRHLSTHPERRRLPPKGGRLGGPPARTLPPVLIRLRPFMVPHTAGSGAAAEGAPGPPASPHAHCIGQGLRRAAPCARPPSIQSVLDLSWPAALSFSSRYAADDDAAPSRTSPTPDRCMSPALISSRAVQYAKRQLSVAAPSFCSPLPVQPSSVRPAIDTTKPSRSSPPSAPHLIHCTPCRSYYHHPRTPLVQSVIAFGRGGLSDGFGGPALRWGAALTLRSCRQERPLWPVRS